MQLFGSEGREEATGRGVMIVLEEVLKNQGKALADCTVALQGFGNVGSRGVTVVPDILANAGGVTVSYFEWAQNIQQFRWELDRIRKELAAYMQKAYRAVKDMAYARQLDLRTAAFVLAIQKVGRAATSRTHWSNHNELMPPGA